MKNPKALSLKINEPQVDLYLSTVSLICTHPNTFLKISTIFRFIRCIGLNIATIVFFHA